MSLAPAGYSGKPLAAKLGLKDGQARAFAGLPDDVAELIGADWTRPAEDLASGTGRNLDVIHVFCDRHAGLEALLPAIRARLRADGMVWISWPKKASRKPTDIDEDALRRLLLPVGLVDVKVCAIDAVWSGLKFVWRKEIRAGLSG